MMEEMMTVSDVARRIGANPKDITELFYRRKVDDSHCPIIGRMRLIPESELPAIMAALRRAGKLPALAAIGGRR